MNDHSDKHLLELARRGNWTAGEILIKRFLGKSATLTQEVLTEWKKPKLLSVSAAKKIACGR